MFKRINGNGTRMAAKDKFKIDKKKLEREKDTKNLYMKKNAFDKRYNTYKARFYERKEHFYRRLCVSA